MIIHRAGGGPENGIRRLRGAAVAAAGLGILGLAACLPLPVLGDDPAMPGPLASGAVIPAQPEDMPAPSPPAGTVKPALSEDSDPSGIPAGASPAVSRETAPAWVPTDGETGADAPAGPDGSADGVAGFGNPMAVDLATEGMKVAGQPRTDDHSPISNYSTAPSSTTEALRTTGK